MSKPICYICSFYFITTVKDYTVHSGVANKLWFGGLGHPPTPPKYCWSIMQQGWIFVQQFYWRGKAKEEKGKGKKSLEFNKKS